MQKSKTETLIQKYLSHQLNEQEFKELKQWIYNPQNHPSTFSKRSVSILRFFSKTKRLF